MHLHLEKMILPKVLHGIVVFMCTSMCCAQYHSMPGDDAYKYKETVWWIKRIVDVPISREGCIIWIHWP
jgi:hypothetical protein